eukprot:g8067.t1
MREFHTGGQTMNSEKFKNSVRGGKDPHGGDAGGRGFFDSYASYGSGYNPELDCLHIVENKIRMVVALREEIERYVDQHNAGGAGATAPQILPALPFLASPSKELRALLRFFLGNGRRKAELFVECPQAVLLAQMVGSYVSSKDALLAEVGGNAYYEVMQALVATDQSGSAELTLLPEDLERVNEVAEFAKEVEWKEWHGIFTRVMRKTNLLLVADTEGNYWSEVRQLNLDPKFHHFGFHAMRKCDGLRDLGNLQDIEMGDCLQRCEENPICLSATWSPTNKRCFLSSVCDTSIATTDYRYLLFEKKMPQGTTIDAGKGNATTRTVRGAGSAPEQVEMSQNSAETTDAAVATFVPEWTPRVGHSMVEFGSEIVVLGGHGVDELAVKGVLKDGEALATSKEKDPAASESNSADAKPTGKTETKKVDKEKGFTGSEGAVSESKGEKPEEGKSAEAGEASSLESAPAGEQDAKKDTITRFDLAQEFEHGVTRRNLVFSYRSRNVDLSDKFIPLRDLPYGRLSDVWDDHKKAAAIGPREKPPTPETAGRKDKDDGVKEKGEAKKAKETEKNEGRQKTQDVEKQEEAPPSAPTAGEPTPDGRGLQYRMTSSSPAPNALPFDYYWRFHTLRSPWRGRSFFGSVVVNDALFLFGGIDETNEYLNDVWKSTDLHSWEEVKFSRTWKARAGFGVASLPAAAGEATAEKSVKEDEIEAAGARTLTATPVALLVGGRGALGRTFKDAWVLETLPAGENEKAHNLRWRRVTTKAPWEARSDFALAVTPGNEVVLHGGRNQNDEILSDAWFADLNGILALGNVAGRDRAPGRRRLSALPAVSEGTQKAPDDVRVTAATRVVAVQEWGDFLREFAYERLYLPYLERYDHNGALLESFRAFFPQNETAAPKAPPAAAAENAATSGAASPGGTASACTGAVAVNTKTLDWRPVFRDAESYLGRSGHSFVTYSAGSRDGAKSPSFLLLIGGYPKTPGAGGVYAKLLDTANAEEQSDTANAEEQSHPFRRVHIASLPDVVWFPRMHMRTVLKNDTLWMSGGMTAEGYYDNSLFSFNVSESLRRSFPEAFLSVSGDKAAFAPKNDTSLLGSAWRRDTAENVASSSSNMQDTLVSEIVDRESAAEDRTSDAGFNYRDFFAARRAAVLACLESMPGSAAQLKNDVLLAASRAESLVVALAAVFARMWDLNVNTEARHVEDAETRTPTLDPLVASPEAAALRKLQSDILQRLPARDRGLQIATLVGNAGPPALTATAIAAPNSPEAGFWRRELEATRIYLETLIRVASAEPSNADPGLGGGMFGGSPYGGGYDDYLTGGSFGGYRDPVDSYLHTRQYPGMMGPGGMDPYMAAMGGGGARGGGYGGNRVMLQHTGDMFCRTPQCSREFPECRTARGNGLGCCADFMFLMLSDVAELLEQLHVPYFLLYGTLLGAVRDADIIPFTQDIDLVVDKRYWELFAVALSAPETLHAYMAKHPEVAKLVLENLTKEAAREAEAEAEAEKQMLAAITTSVAAKRLALLVDEDLGGRGGFSGSSSSSTSTSTSTAPAAAQESASTGLGATHQTKSVAAQVLSQIAGGKFGGIALDKIKAQKPTRATAVTTAQVGSGGASTKAEGGPSSKSSFAPPQKLPSKRQWKKFFQPMQHKGQRRYNFGVDQWEPKVARVCADYTGFPSTQFKPSSDVKSDPLNNLDMFGDKSTISTMERGVDYHLDFYNVDWWVFEELKLSDCMGGADVGLTGQLQTKLKVRDRLFSVPARPRSCVEKLYGAEWAVVRKGLNGVN